MPVSLEPSARVLLGRIVRSMSPWRVRALLDVDRAAMQVLVTARFVEVDRDTYRPTPAGRAALTP